MREIFAKIPGELVDIIIYSTILFVFLAGLFKCVFPYRRGSGLFRRAIRSLEFMKPGKDTEKAWQEPLFLGSPLRDQWSRFLLNARHLDQKGLSCNTEDYINDDDVFAAWAHLQLAEVIPGLLTSLAETASLSKAGLDAITEDLLRAALDLAARAAAITVSRPGANPPWRHELG